MMVRKRRITEPGKALLAALQRLLREAGRAVGKFPGEEEVQAHFLRTRVKRLQSLCRLVPQGRRWREGFLTPCRELKDLFEETRDATVVRALAEAYAPGEALHLRIASVPDLVRAQGLVTAAEAALGDYPRWGLVAWGDIADRAEGTYRAARRAWRDASRGHAADAAFHDWRRRVKRLLYQCEFLGGQARLVRFTRRVEGLGEVLGDFQDVCVAEDWFRRLQGLPVPPDLGRSKDTLRRDALRRAPALLLPRPKVFRGMLG